MKNNPGVPTRPSDEDLKPNEFYCLLCQRVLTALTENADGSFVFVHDEFVVHTDEDWDAMEKGVQ